MYELTDDSISFFRTKINEEKFKQSWFRYVRRKGRNGKKRSRTILVSEETGTVCDYPSEFLTSEMLKIIRDRTTSNKEMQVNFILHLKNSDYVHNCFVVIGDHPRGTLVSKYRETMEGIPIMTDDSIIYITPEVRKWIKTYKSVSYLPNFIELVKIPGN